MSGFSYPTWIPDFYPKGTKPSDMLTTYATRFRSVEMNVTFRRNIPETTVAKWRAAVDGDFRFTVKAHQRITHFRRLVGAKDAVREFVDSMSGLGHTLGVVLFQTRSNLKFDADVLDAFCAELPSGPSYALEARHESFASHECDAILANHNVSRCLNDEIFEPATYTLTGPVAYFRFHRTEPYTPKELAVRAEVVRDLSERADVYVIFKHEDDPASIRPALAFQELVRSAST